MEFVACLVGITLVTVVGLLYSYHLGWDEGYRRGCETINAVEKTTKDSHEYHREEIRQLAQQILQHCGKVTPTPLLGDPYPKRDYTPLIDQPMTNE